MLPAASCAATTEDWFWIGPIYGTSNPTFLVQLEQAQVCLPGEWFIQADARAANLNPDADQTTRSQSTWKDCPCSASNRTLEQFVCDVKTNHSYHRIFWKLLSNFPMECTAKPPINSSTHCKVFRKHWPTNLYEPLTLMQPFSNHVNMGTSASLHFPWLTCKSCQICFVCMILGVLCHFQSITFHFENTDVETLFKM